jgi:hypothetical protein
VAFTKSVTGISAFDLIMHVNMENEDVILYSGVILYSPVIAMTSIDGFDYIFSYLVQLCRLKRRMRA